MVSSQNIWEDLFMKLFGLEYMTLPCQSPMADLRKQNEQDYPWKVNFFLLVMKVGDAEAICVRYILQICIAVIKLMSDITHKTELTKMLVDQTSMIIIELKY